MRTADPEFLQVITEAAPDGLLVADEGGRILLVNRQIEELFGYAREELVGHPIELLMPERYRGGHILYVQSFGRHPSRRPMGSGLDLWGRRKDGSEFPLEISLSPVTTEEGAFAITAIRDVTDRKNLEDDRRRTEDRYRLLAEHAQDIVFRVRLSTGPPRVEYISPSVTRITGHRPEDHYADPALLLDEVHPDDRPMMERLLEDPTAVTMPVLLRMLHSDGAPAWHELNCSVVQDPAGRLIALEGMARDVTARVEAEFAREHLLVASEMQQDRERIARDLHDGVMQTLYAAGLGLQGLTDALPSDSVAAGTIAETITLLRGAITDIRGYVMDLRSDELSKPLLELLTELVSDMQGQGELAVVLELPERLPDLDRAQQEALAHIVREALSNVRRHAHAQAVRVAVSVDADTIALFVEDDGNGFEPQAARGDEHLGLGNMVARAHALRGTLEIDSAPGSGTRLRCAFPLQPTVAAAV
jgi:PAS domain S-box-containing protein